MTNALNIIRYIFNKFLVLLFDSFTIANNVSIGWVIVSIVIIAIMISNILSLAKNGVSIKHDQPFKDWNKSDTNWRSKW